MKSRPPIIVLIFSVFYFFVNLFGLIMSIKTLINNKPNSIYYYSSFGLILLGFIAITGIIKLRKWGVYFYFSLVVVTQISLIISNRWTLIFLIVPVTFLSIFIYHRKSFK